MARWHVGIAGLQDPRSLAAVRQWAELPGAAVIAAADPDAAVRSRELESGEYPRIYPSWQEMLRGEALHFIHIALPPHERADLVEEAASRGIHCVLEPPMAGSLDQAERMVAAVRRAGVYLTVNWPAGFDPALAYVLQLLRTEEIGPVTSIEYRRRSALPAAGSERITREAEDNSVESDAWRDAAPARSSVAPGINLLRWLIGIPSCCIGIVPGDPEEALSPMGILAILKYRSLLGVVETSSSPGFPDPLPDLIVRGTAGFIAVTGAVVSIHRAASRDCDERIVPDPGESASSAPEQLLAAVLCETEPHGPGNLQVSRDTQEMIDAVALSAELGRAIPLPLG